MDKKLHKVKPKAVLKKLLTQQCVCTSRKVQKQSAGFSAWTNTSHVKGQIRVIDVYMSRLKVLQPTANQMHNG